MKLSEVHAISLPRPAGGGMVCPTVLWDGETAVLVDTGFPGMLPAIRGAFERIGVPFDKIGTVILTHQDVDHTGSLPDVLTALDGRAEAVCHELEKPYIEGTKPLVKADPAQFEKMAGSAPGPARSVLEHMIHNPPTARIGRTAAHLEELPLCGGLVVIHTPGHTPGHISLYHRPSRTLISGDALTASEGKLNGPREPAAQDIGQARRSLARFFDFNIDTVICYHGGVCRGNMNARIRELAASV